MASRYLHPDKRSAPHANDEFQILSAHVDTIMKGCDEDYYDLLDLFVNDGSTPRDLVGKEEWLAHLRARVKDEEPLSTLARSLASSSSGPDPDPSSSGPLPKIFTLQL